MKFARMQRDPSNRDVVMIYLEVWAAIREAVASIWWYGLFVMLGISLHRAYIHLVGF